MDRAMFAKLTVKGVIVSELCDLIPAEDGVVGEMWVYVSDGDRRQTLWHLFDQMASDVS